MYVVYGTQSRVMKLHGTRHYMPEQILSKLEVVFKAHGNVRLSCEGEIMRLQKEDLRVTSFVVAAYHNGMCNGLASPDHWDAETKYMEDKAEEHMLAESSTEEEDYAHNDSCEECWYETD